MTNAPMIGTFGRCASAANGHTAAAPPSSMMNSRLLMPTMGSSSPVTRVVIAIPWQGPIDARFTARSVWRREAGKYSLSV